MTAQERAVMKQALEALEAMKAEFRALDLPYGSKAYTQGNEASNVLLAALSAFLDTHRWNIERDGEALLICEGQHEKHEPCEYQRYVLAETEAKQAALASMYIALCDAMGYSECKGDRMYSPEEWAAHLYAKTLRTPTDDASLFGKLGRVMWEMTTTVHSPGISFSEQLELIPTIWSELAKSHRAQRPLLTDEEIEMMWSLTPQDDRREGIYFARRIEKMIRGEKE